MAFEDLGVQLSGFAAAHRADEIGEMAGAAFEGFDLGAVVVVDVGAGVAGNDHAAAIAMDDDADAGAEVFIHFGGASGGGQAADFEDERGFGVIVQDEQAVGGGAVVGIAEAAADAQDAGGEAVLA